MPAWLSDRGRPAPGEARSATLALELTATGWFGSRPCAARGLKRAEKGLFRQSGVVRVESLSARPLSGVYGAWNDTPCIPRTAKRSGEREGRGGVHEKA